MRTRYIGVIAMSIALKVTAVLSVLTLIMTLNDAAPLLQRDFLLWLGTILSPLLNIFAYYATGELVAMYARLAEYAEEASDWLREDVKQYDRLQNELDRVQTLVEQRGQGLQRWLAARQAAQSGQE